MHYYKLNIADWNLSTAHLSPECEAIYFRLVNHYYDTETLIPLETQSVFNRLRLSGNEEKALGILGEFFELTDNGWKHKRCDIELKEYHQMAKKNRKNGKKGGRPIENKGLGDNPVGYSGKPKHNPLATQTEPTGPNHKPLTINQEPLTNIQDSESGDSVLTPKVVNDPVPYSKIVDLYHELLPELRGVQTLSNKRKSHIRSRWKTGGMTELKKWSNYFKFVKQSDFLMGKVEPINGRKVFQADIDWLINESNLLKVAEGKYHDGELS